MFSVPYRTETKLIINSKESELIIIFLRRQHHQINYFYKEMMREIMVNSLEVLVHHKCLERN